MNRAIPAFLSLAALVVCLSGCATLGYYGQAISGHFSLLGRSRPIDELLADTGTAPALKRKLESVVAIRNFATESLGLPDNDSYRRYTDLERPFVVWNVFAAPELSLKPKEWCFPVAGCVSYRGYFARADAEQEAKQLRAEGYEVLFGGVQAYSTLGWFDDPLLNTMLDRPEAELAGLIFHELAHQKLYVRHDSAFNESFATVVEREGVRRWLAAHAANDEYDAYLERSRRREEFIQLLLRYRDKLNTLYGSPQTDDVKRAGKRALFDELRREYGNLKQRWNGYAAYDRWMEELNNARFVSIGVYHDHVAAFETLLARHNGDLPAFYRATEAIAREPLETRAKLLAELASDGTIRQSNLK